MNKNLAISHPRLKSLDFFRGLTIALMILVNDPGDWGHVYSVFLHAPWNGCTLADLVFPFFLFIVGVSINLSLNRIRNNPGNISIYIKIVRRALILFAIGLFLNSFPYFEISSIRIPGVLQRIAVCYFISALVFLKSSQKTQYIFSALLLLGYWLIMETGALAIDAGETWEKGTNFSAFFDSLFLTGHMWSVTGSWDPEGIISTIPALATTHIGVLAGILLSSNDDPLQKVKKLLMTGFLLTVAGLIWSFWMPINKNIWTSSYAVFTSGLALIVFGISYYTIDIKQWKKAIRPFEVYGLNAISVYVLSMLVAQLLVIISWTGTDGEQYTVQGWIYINVFTSWLGPKDASLLYAVCFVAVIYIPAWILWKKRMVIKI